MTEQREARALLGFMDEQEAIIFLKGRCILEDSTDNKLKEIWKAAKSAITSSSIYNLTPEISEIDSRFSSELEAISKEPLFAEAVLQKEWGFKLVEIDKLVCFQRYVDTDYSDDISKKYDLTDLGKLIEFSLTHKPLKRPIGQILEPEQKVQTLL